MSTHAGKGTGSLMHSNTWRSCKHTKHTRAALFRPSLYICHLFLNVIIAEFCLQPKRCLFWILFLQTNQGFNFSHMVDHCQTSCCMLCGQRTENEVTLQPCFGCNSQLSLKFAGEKNKHFNTFAGRNIWLSVNGHLGQP